MARRTLPCLLFAAAAAAVASGLSWRFSGRPASEPARGQGRLAESGGTNASGSAFERQRASPLAQAHGHYGDAALYMVEAARLEYEGRSAEAREAWNQAVESLEAAAREDPEGVEIHRALAACYMRLGRADKAAQVLGRLARMAPNSAAVRIEIAQAYRSLNENDEAVAEYQKAVRAAAPASDEWRQAVSELAALYRAKGEPARAIPLYRSLVEKEAEDPQAVMVHHEGSPRMGLAFALSESGQHQEAIAVLLPLARAGGKLSGPALVRARYLLASEYERAGKVDEGVEVFAQMAKDNPDSSEVCQSRMHLFDAAGQLDRAIALGDEFLRAHRDADAVRLVLAGLYQKAGRLGQGIELYREALARGEPIRTVAARQLLLLSMQLAKEKKTDMALQVLDNLLAARDLTAFIEEEARAQMAMLYHDRRELDKAVAVLKLLLDRGRNPDWRVGLLYAECLRDAGQAQGALKFLQGLLQEHAGRPEALVRIHYTMGGIYQLPGVENEAKAEEHLKSALALDPSHAGAANALGYFYAQKGQHLDEAEKLLEGALKQQPDEPAFLDSLGWIYYKQALLGDKTDRLRRALAKLQAAVKGLGQGAAADPVVACHLADVCFVSGEWEQAKDWWERALAAPQEPGAEPIDRELTQRKLTLVTNRLRDELRQQGQPRKSGERMARPLAAPMP